ncbi:MAG: hypothetical protein AMJ69_01500 [Gammaproteobacteria bacterium SG8_47]|nr:MAG: hypothetical protein AMJ69_01500 [Gammaproteobacteria bacterium SG8_47]
MSVRGPRKAFHAWAWAALLGLLGSGGALADELNMTPGVTSISREVYDLHMLVMWICTIVGIGVFGVIIYSIINHRKSKGAQAAQFHESTTVEIVWTIIPFIVLIAIAIPATKALLDLEDSSDPDMTIKVTGWQWKWEYEYLDDGIHFFSNLDAESNKARQRNSGIDPASVDHYLLNVDKPLVVPINKKIRFLLTANDVIHSWWVPALGFKKDTIPGFINDAWARIEQPGIYRGQCAELCGKDHGFMPIVVEAKTEEDYKKWLVAQKEARAAELAAAGQAYTKADLMKKGEEVYAANCAACHLPGGEGTGPFPALKGSAVATAGPIADHIKIIVTGKGMMPPFGTQLNDLDIAAVTTYERNAWGNDTGDIVQPSDVKSAR